MSYTVPVIDQQFDPAIPLAALRPHPKNPKRHAKEIIKEGIQALGFFGAIYVQKSTHYILAGHGRVEELLEEGAETAPGLWMDVDDDTAEKILLIDNRAPEAGGFHEELLAEMLASRAEMGDLWGTGYSADAVDDLLARTGDVDVLPPEEFGGGYVENEDEANTRAQKQAVTKESRGLRELVLVYPDDKYREVEDAIHVIREFHSTDSTSDTVSAALINYAKGLEA